VYLYFQLLVTTNDWNESATCNAFLSARESPFGGNAILYEY
jgi:hypothetical protein